MPLTEKQQHKYIKDIRIIYVTMIVMSAIVAGIAIWKGHPEVGAFIIFFPCLVITTNLYLMNEKTKEKPNKK